MFRVIILLVLTAFVPVVTICAQDDPFGGKPKPAIAVKPGEQPGGEGKNEKGGNPSGEGEENKEGEDGKPPEQPEPKVIRRGDLPEADANPNELKAEVGTDGKVAFQFRNQPWVELTQWLSDISDQPLDWLELPADRVNLVSPGRYTVAETKDLFNRHLLARGYTILELDGGMTIVKTKDINPAMVPRVTAAKLAELSPHTFVRSSFDVGWLSAVELSTELAGMVSSNGRLTALATTNRIDAMDAAVNLRHIAQLLEQERDAANVEALAPEFKLRYLGAIEAKRMLEEFLGVEKKKSAPMTPQQMQMMMQMQQRNQGGGTQKKGSDSVSIVANTRQNSVIIRAPVDRTAIAMEFLKRIDVPSESMLSLADVESRVEVFRLHSLDPEKLIEIVSEMNVLEPTSKVRPDKDNHALIVSASAADRYIIKRLIERLDGSGRSLEVLQLRRLDANDVAESISFLMGQKKEEDDSSSRGRYSWYGYEEKEEDKNKDEFRVAANARFRQVLLWATENEMKQVENLLVKLGELPPPGGSGRTTRIIDASATPETLEYLQRLQKQWNRMSPNQLELPEAAMFKDPIKEFKKSNEEAASKKSGNSDEEEVDDNDQKSKEKAPAKPVGIDDVASVREPNQFHLTVAQPPQAATEPQSIPEIKSADDFDRAFRKKVFEKNQSKQETESSKPASIRIEVDPDGNLMLVSPDTKALDQLENMMLQIRPPRRPYRVFKIEFASSYWIKLNLEDYFEEEDENKDDEADRFYNWFFDEDEEEDTGPSGLGRGNKMRFVDDPDTNTIVVTGANNEQLRTIAELIELWDVQEPVNKRKMRFTRLVNLKYGKADTIAETIKEAYRDLLSSNDKSFGGGGGQNQGGQKKKDVARNREGNGSGLVDQKNGNDGGAADFSFKGKLSIGIDPVGNTLLVSAEGEALLELVTDVISQLDDAAQPAGDFHVLQLDGEVSGKSLAKALESFGAKVQTESRGQGSGPGGPAKTN